MLAIKTILSAISGSTRDDAALTAACDVATQLDAHVDVLFARMSPTDAVPMVGEGVSSTVVEQLVTTAEREWSHRAGAARRSFDAICARTGLPIHDTPPGPGRATIQWREQTGREDLLVRQLCPLYDLIVLANQSGGDGDLQFTLTLESALLSGGRPILLAPPQMPATVGRRVAIAWNGGPQCARAVSGALPLIARAEAVHVLSAATPRTDVARAIELTDYLAWHGISAVAQGIDPSGVKVGVALLDKAADVGADLFVMGGYGHSRMREMILGGVTRHVLSNATLPVLMAH